jgi:hypothetical protein
MGIIKKIAIGLCLVLTTQAFADVTLVVPQKVGGGTSVWASIVAKEMEKYLDEKVILQHYPSARDIGGFNKFHNEYKDRDDVIMVSHGGNGVSFLTEEVDYVYADYESIGLMNLNIIVAKRKDFNPDKSVIKFSAGSGQTPEAFAITLLQCGWLPTTQLYVDCFKDEVVWVSGMSGGERRLAFRRGELNGTRENPAAYKKHVSQDENAEVWFHHGIIVPPLHEGQTAKHIDDENYKGYLLEDLFFQKWGYAPKGDFYEAYKLVKSFRDGMQKALWVHKGNPNRDRYVAALNKVASNPESIAAVAKKVGNYDWYTGVQGDEHRDILMTLIDEGSLGTLIDFNRSALGLDAVYKEELLVQ